MSESWVSTPSFPGFEASNLGRVRAAKRPDKIKAHYLQNGYCIVSMGTKKRRTHVVVADAFLGPKPRRMDVNHKDGNKQNNRPENLEYVTRSENHRHAFRLGLAKSPFTGRVGEKHYLAKLKDRDVLTMREEFANGVPRRDLATKYGISYYTVWDITTGRSFRHL